MTDSFATPVYSCFHLQMHHTGINEEVDIRPTRLGSKGSMIAFTVQGIAKQLGVEEKTLEEWKQAILIS
jgi:hypothetical protein